MALFTWTAMRLYPGKRTAVMAMLVIAFNPWHFMISRWALESNLFPTLALAAFYCLLRGLRSPRWLYAFSAIMALSLYAYGTAYFFVPIFLAGTIFLLLYKKVLDLRLIVRNALVFAAISWPIVWFVVINRWQLPPLHVYGFSIPRLTMQRVEQLSSVFGEHGLATMTSNFKTLLRIMWTGEDGLIWNAIPRFGYAYLFGFPLIAAGFIISLLDLTRGLVHKFKGLRVFKLEDSRVNRLGTGLVLLWIFIAMLMAGVADVNINRINIIFYPLLLLMTRLLVWLSKKGRGMATAGIAAAIIIGFTAFSHEYFRELPPKVGPAFHESLGEAISYASGITDGVIVVTDQVNMPYIYALFYGKANPREFAETVNYVNPQDGFRFVSSFGRYQFRQPGVMPSGGEAYVYRNSEPMPDSSDFHYERFANYTAVVPLNVEAGSNSVQNGAEQSETLGLINGGFEHGERGWHLGSGAGISYNRPYAGNYLAYLDGGNASHLYQTFTATDTGVFIIEAMISSGGTGGKMSVLVNGNQHVTEIDYGESYRPVSVSGIALSQGNEITVRFDGGNGWINIDEVRISEDIR